MCAIHNHLISFLISVALFGLLILLIAISRSLRTLLWPAYDSSGSQATGLRLFMLALLCLFLFLADTPWQVARARYYYSSATRYQAVVVLQRTPAGFMLPRYRYQARSSAPESFILADASLIPRNATLHRSTSFNWLHHDGESVPIRATLACPTTVWTHVQDVSLVVGLLPLVGIVFFLLVPSYTLTGPYPPRSPTQTHEERWRRS